jgi:hypothetical protein
VPDEGDDVSLDVAPGQGNLRGRLSSGAPWSSTCSTSDREDRGDPVGAEADGRRKCLAGKAAIKRLLT